MNNDNFYNGTDEVGNLPILKSFSFEDVIIYQGPEDEVAPDLPIRGKCVSFEDNGMASTKYFDMSKVHDDKANEEEFDDNPDFPGEEDKNDVFSVVSSYIAAKGIADTKSFRIICAVIFVGDMARGIFFPTMLDLCEKLGGDLVLLGYVTASFNFGRMMALPFFGRSSATKGYRWTLTLSMGIMIFASIMMTQVLMVGTQWYLILSNTMLGVGSGTLAVSRAYTGEVTPRKTRTGYMALISAIQYSGTTVTPLIGSLFAFLFSVDEDKEVDGFFELDQFSSPAFLMTVSCGCLLYLLLFHFQDRPILVNTVPLINTTIQTATLGSNESSSGSTTCCGKLTIYSAVLIGCAILNVFIKGSMSCFETFGIDFAENRFDLAYRETGAIISFCGFCGASTLLLVKLSIAERLSDTQIMMTGYVFFVIGIAINTFLNEDPDLNPTWQYVLSMFFIYSIGYPACHVGLIGMFSKVVGRRPQGTLLAFFSMAGSISRIAFPIVSSYLIEYNSIEAVFIILASLLAASLVTVFVFRKTLTVMSKKY